MLFSIYRLCQVLLVELIFRMIVHEGDGGGLSRF